MQFLKQLLVILLLTVMVNYLLPWWSVALVGFLVAYYTVSYTHLDVYKRQAKI